MCGILLLGVMNVIMKWLFDVLQLGVVYLA